MPKSKAHHILASYWDHNLPVDPVFLAAKRSVAVQANPMDTEHSGHYQPQGQNGRPLITYNPLEHPVRQRFTIAHELGHHELGHGESDRDTPSSFFSGVKSPKEREANQFAAEILMPAEALEAIISVRKITDIASLAALFFVSRPAMTYRLRGLGYVVE